MIKINDDAILFEVKEEVKDSDIVEFYEGLRTTCINLLLADSRVGSVEYVKNYNVGPKGGE